MRLAVLALLIAAAPVAVAAQSPLPQSAIAQRLIACRKIEATTERLACYDAMAQAFDQAQAAGDIVVVDREQAEKVRRQAFGFTLPSLSLFDRPARSGEKPEVVREEADRLTTTLKQGRQRGDGKWMLELEDGAMWIQTDNEPLPRGAKPGAKVEIRRAAMGSFFINVDGQRAIRAVRSR
ncbi:MAG: hypothetical protein U1C74_10605 [Phenylobacterium sp.]|nr:hypothetical protein [Phenylobacterium sp.]